MQLAVAEREKARLGEDFNFEAADDDAYFDGVFFYFAVSPNFLTPSIKATPSHY